MVTEELLAGSRAAMGPGSKQGELTKEPEAMTAPFAYVAGDCGTGIGHRISRGSSV